MNEVYQNLGIRNRDSLSNLFRGMVNPKSGVLTEMDLGGVKKVHDVVYPIILELGQEDPLWLMAYRTFLANAQRTINSVKVSSVFNEAFKNPTVESVKEVLGKFIKCRNKWGEFEELIDRLDGYKDRRKKALKANTTRQETTVDTATPPSSRRSDMPRKPTLGRYVRRHTVTSRPESPAARSVHPKPATRAES